MAKACKRCGEELSSKQALIRHLKRLVPCSANESDIDRDEYIKQLVAKTYNEVTYPCKHCESRFNTQSSMYRHMKVCKKAHEATSDDVQTCALQNEVLELKNTVNSLKESIDGISSLLVSKANLSGPQVTNMYSNVVINNTILVNSFGKETMAHITPEFLSHCLLNPKKGLPSLIESIHYNTGVPENHNIRFKSWKRNVFEKYDDSQWKECDASNTLDELIRKGYKILNAHYTEHFLNDPDIFEDENKQRMYERFRFLSDTTCNDYNAVKRELRVLVKDRTMYILAPPEGTMTIELE